MTDPKLFETFLDRFSRDTRVVFLSMQGDDKHGYLPHAKIERTIVRMGFDHVFVRPSYFFDNLITTLWPELRRNNRIFLPAEKLKLDWVSARDVADVCAAALIGPLVQPALLVTSGQLMGFQEICARVNATLGTSIEYQPAGLVSYLRYSRSQGAQWSYVLVMLLLHYLPRFAPAPRPELGDLKTVLGRDPERIETFAKRHASMFGALL